jgi:hypothetical protein
MKTQALLSYQRKTLGIAVRALGFLGLVKENCEHCSCYPDCVLPASKDVGEVVDRTDRLIVLLEGKDETVKGN